MRLTLISLCSAALSLALAQGCVISSPDSLGDTSGDQGSGAGSGSGSGTGTGTGGAGGAGDVGPTEPASDTGLPCEVAFVLSEWCRACHSNPPVAGAHVPMMKYEDLIAPMPGDPSTTVGEAALARMRDTAAPMPPGNVLPEADITPFAAWVEAGMPSQSCASDPGNGGPNPYDTPPVCTSDSYWGMGDEGSGDMLPGRACISCHSQTGGDEGPRFIFSGTVYPTAHEPDDCNGAGGAIVEITDANGTVITATARGASGNFYKGGDPADIAWPITAKVTQDGKEIKMITPVMTGDCNACHTQIGKEGAPGRIILPP